MVILQVNELKKIIHHHVALVNFFRLRFVALESSGQKTFFSVMPPLFRDAPLWINFLESTEPCAIIRIVLNKF